MTAPAPQAPTPLKRRRRPWRAPDWLQLAVIFALFAAAIYVATEGRYLWCALLVIPGVLFALSFILRRMVGDEYDRT